MTADVIVNKLHNTALSEHRKRCLNLREYIWKAVSILNIEFITKSDIWQLSKNGSWMLSKLTIYVCESNGCDLVTSFENKDNHFFQ